MLRLAAGPACMESAGQRGYLTRFVYDDNYKRIAVLDTNNHATTSVYDQSGNTLDNAGGAFTTDTWDANNPPVGKCNA
jgi:YD repeat-containing protein